MHFEIYSRPLSGIINAAHGTPHEWRWRLVADNGEPLASGEGYHNKEDCLHAIELVKSTDQSTIIKEVPSKEMINLAKALKAMPPKV